MSGQVSEVVFDLKLVHVFEKIELNITNTLKSVDLAESELTTGLFSEDTSDIYSTFKNVEPGPKNLVIF